MAANHKLEVSSLENWLWEAACVIRGPIDAPKFKDYILPLVFLKRLSDVFDDEVNDLGENAKFVDKDHDLVEAVVLLPENLFYNTTASGIILEAWPKSHSFLSDNFGMTPVQYTNEICWHYSSPAPNGQIFG
jgi:type I restriction-modification system DNA methylase subunit